MKMKNGLPTVRAAVDDQPVPTVVDANIPCDLVRRRREPAHDAVRIAAQIGDCFDVCPWYDKDMHRGRGVYVPEGHDVFVFVDQFGLQRSSGDTAEQALGHDIALQ